MIRSTILSFALIFLVSCNFVGRQNDEYLDLNNKDLEREIVNYYNFCDSISKNDQFVVHVTCMDINDSISKYVLEGLVSAEVLYWFPYHFKCKVDSHDTYFTMKSGLVLNNKRNNLFTLKQSAIEQFMKIHFPDEYANNYKKNKEEYIRLAKKNEILGVLQPRFYCLTFKNGKLIKKDIIQTTKVPDYSSTE